MKTNKDKFEKLLNKKFSERLRKMVNEFALFSLEQKRKMCIIEPSDDEKKLTNNVMEEMRKQLTFTHKDALESMNNNDYRETIDKTKEITED